MRATSWTGSENARRQEPTEHKPSPYAADAAKILPTTCANFSVRVGTKLETRIDDSEPWQAHTTRRQLDVYDYEIDGDRLVFRAYGRWVRVKRIAVALPRQPKRARWHTK